MSLSDDFKEWQYRLGLLLEDSAGLEERIDDLERHNKILREQLSEAHMRDGGMDALRKLYDDGFHICHARFAQVREEDCLFCLSFLHRGGIA